MNKRRATDLAVALLLAALLLPGSGVLAQDRQDLTGLVRSVSLRDASQKRVGSGAEYNLSWWTADGGGRTFSTGAGYSLGGAIGQPDAGLLAGSGYHLSGGFWSGAAAVYNIYLPIILRAY